MRMTRSLLSLARRLRLERTGAAAVELALVAPMLVGIVLPMVDLAMGAYNKMRVQDAAEAGAQYALASGYNATSVASAAQNATVLGTGVTVTSQSACYCIVNGAIPNTTSTCGAACSDGSTAGTYVTVATQSTYTPLIMSQWLTKAIPGMTNPMTLSGKAIVRIN
jgi:Flp pilus assembly protein TadG